MLAATILNAPLAASLAASLAATNLKAALVECKTTPSQLCQDGDISDWIGPP